MCIKNIREKYLQIIKENVKITKVNEVPKKPLIKELDYPVVIPTENAGPINCPRFVILTGETLQKAKEIEDRQKEYHHPYNYYKFLCGDPNDKNIEIKEKTGV